SRIFIRLCIWHASICEMRWPIIWWRNETMSENNLNSTPPPDDPLDELLQKATWPVPDQLQLARLEQEWEKASAKSAQLNSRTVILRTFALVAACLCVALGVWWFVARD